MASNTLDHTNGKNKRKGEHYNAEIIYSVANTTYYERIAPGSLGRSISMSHPSIAFFALWRCSSTAMS
jgi:hypothetical protein